MPNILVNDDSVFAEQTFNWLVGGNMRYYGIRLIEYDGAIYHWFTFDVIFRNIKWIPMMEFALDMTTNNSFLF